jgi:hypothetical protein
MKKSKNIINRRDFLRGAAYAGLAATMGLPFETSWAEDEIKKTKVVLVRDSQVIDDKGNVDADVIQQMLDQAIAVLFDIEEPLEAWKQLVNADDIVGIKSNEWADLPTPEELEQAIKNRLMKVGVPARNIDIDDRGVLYSKTFLKSTALINVRPLRTHHWSGIGGCIKNYIMFVPDPYNYHNDSCADLAVIWKKPLVKDKTRLNILVLLTPLFYGIGPHHFDKTYTWHYKGILVGTDPVALDAVGVQLLEAKRQAYFDKARPILPPPHHVAYADIRHHLGTSDQRKIELVKLGWQEDVLI